VRWTWKQTCRRCHPSLSATQQNIIVNFDQEFLNSHKWW
jgi:hypothetical protein